MLRLQAGELNVVAERMALFTSAKAEWSMLRREWEGKNGASKAKRVLYKTG